MAKRAFDIAFAMLALILSLPVMAIACLLIWAEDGHSPLYLGVRVGRAGRDFRMLKLRTMVAGAEHFGGSSTPASDRRLTSIGPALRRFKVDELPQFWNVLIGDMSIVGPRPNLRAGGVDRYTSEEVRLLSIRPGITDLASIVFSDEGLILDGAGEADALYDQIIRPWKSALGLLYVHNRSLRLDVRIIWLTAIAIGSHARALAGVAKILSALAADQDLQRICRRLDPLPHGTPPGAPAQLPTV